MIGNVSLNFSDLVIIRERVEIGVRSGKIAQVAATTNTNKPPIVTYKRKEGETNTIISTPTLPNYTHIPNYQPYFTYNPQIAIISQPSYQQPYQPKMAFRPPRLQVSTSQMNLLGVPQPSMDNTQKKKNNQIRTLPQSPLPHLIQNSLVIPTSLKPIQSPYPKNFDSNAKCDDHTSAISHTTERRLVSFKENGLNVGNNLLPSYKGTSINVVEGD
ncbi:hypothetical protein CR513_17351, partial [Mucuna pruriens]